METKYDRTVKAKIIMVDDLPENLRTLSHLLSDRGYQITCVSSGEIALNLIQTELPDLVFLSR